MTEQDSPESRPQSEFTFPVWVREAAAKMEARPPVHGPPPDRDAYRDHIERLAEEYGLPVDGTWPRWAGSEPVEY